MSPVDRLPSSHAPSEARSVAVIMDGNGRWAAARGLPVAEGHREGARALRRTVEAAIDLGVQSLAVYAFSTENWARPPDEVESIMELMDETIDRELPDLARQGVRTRFVGRRDRVLRHQDPFGSDLERSQRCCRVRREERVPGAGGEDHDATLLQVADRAATDVRLGDLGNRDG